MTTHNRVRISKLAIGLAIALAAAPAFAQNTTSALGGRISSEAGQAVAGAEVTIVHTESGSVSKATTDAEGRFLARGLRVGGPYTITTTKDGKTETREGVYLELAQTGNVDIKFADATTLAAVQVTGARAADIFDSKKMGAGTSISREKLTTFASIQRNLQDYARLDPRLSQTDKDRGEISAGGQNSRFNSITIDGVSTNDTFGLEANNLPTAKQPISIDAIQSVQVNISNYDVTQKGYTGANINAVTKSGTNDFKGSVYYVYRNDSLSGDRFNRKDNTYFSPANFKEDTKGFTFGGPIIEDRLFFFTSYEELKSTRNAPSFGTIGSGLTSTGISDSSITSAQSIASGTWGMDIGQLNGDPGELDVTDALIKLDANLGERHRASLRWSKTEQADPILPGFSQTGLSLSSHWFNQGKSIETFVGQWFADWSDSFSTEVKLSYRDYASTPTNNANLPAIGVRFVDPSLPSTSATRNRFLNFGTERSRHFNDLATETWNLYLGGNLFVGDHELKFGADYDDNKVYNAFLQDTKGNYTFGCINSSGAVPYTSSGVPGGTVVCANVLNSGGVIITPASSAAVINAAALENFQRGRPVSYQVQVAAPGFTLNDGVAQWDYQNLGVFLQDTWSVNDKLTLTLGVRADQKQMNTSPLYNPIAGRAVINGSLTNSTNPQNGTVLRAGGISLPDGTREGGFGRRNDLTLDGNTLIQPRFGFNYTFDSERPTQIRGGFGLFEGAAANVWLSNPYSNTGVPTRIIGCGFAGVAACPAANAFFSPNPDNPVTDPNGNPMVLPNFGTPSSNVDFLSAELEQPSVWKVNLAFEHELPFFGGATFSAEYIRTLVNDGIYYKNLNIGLPTRIGTDGRELFYHPVGYNTACFDNTGARINPNPPGCSAGANSLNRALNNPAYNNVLLAERTGKGGGDNFTVGLNGSFQKEWNWALAYSFTTAEEVSPLTSSVSFSSWASRSIFNPNEEVAANSAYLVRDRFTGQLNWKHNFFGNYATRVGLVYEGRKGKPYSWTYGNDLNGDGTINDLLYIPTAQGSGEVVFRDVNASGSAADEEQTFWNLVRQNGLDSFAGSAVKRNSAFAPWSNNFDLRISQEFPGFFEGNKASLTLDILNVGNLLNKKWGRIDEIEFSSAGGLTRTFVNYLGLDANGRYIYGVDGTVEDLITRNNKGESAWAAQLTVKYEF